VNCNYVLHSQSYRPTGILVHQQNSYAPRCRRCTGRRETHKAVNQSTKVRTSLYDYNYEVTWFLWESWKQKITRK
jgi:hypothetical protein